MFQRLLFAACVSLTVASLGAKELSEKSRFARQLNSNTCDSSRGPVIKCGDSDECIPQDWTCDGDDDCGDGSDESDCVVRRSRKPGPYSDYMTCMRTAIESCGGDNPFVYFRPFGENHEALINVLAENDVREFCSIVQSGYECVRQAFGRCGSASFQWIDELVSLALDYVCVQHVDVFNRDKACLFTERETGSRRNFPVLTIIYEACENLALTTGPRKFCIPDELRECAKDAVAAQCGIELANALSGLADILGEAVRCSESRVRELSKTRKHFQGFSPSKEYWVDD